MHQYIQGAVMTVQIFDPTPEPKKDRPHRLPAPRPISLAGLRIGLVDNSKFNSDQLLLRIAGLLERDLRRQDAPHAPQAQRWACRRRRKSSTSSKRAATSSSPASVIEGHAARAVCSTA
jgi:hypothetical protein